MKSSGAKIDVNIVKFLLRALCLRGYGIVCDH